MDKIIKLVFSCIAISSVLLCSSCTDKSTENSNKEEKTLTNKINTTQVTTVINNETSRKNIIKNEYTDVNALDVKTKIPGYSSKDTIKTNKYSTTVYYIEPNEVLVGVSIYTSKEVYPDGVLEFDYSEIESVNSVNRFVVTDTVRRLKKITDKNNFIVDECEYMENKDVKTKHNVYKFTGYIYTDLFASKPSGTNTSDRNLVYYYSNGIKTGKNVVVLWVMDLTEDHRYQKECAEILNDIMMDKI